MSLCYFSYSSVAIDVYKIERKEGSTRIGLRGPVGLKGV